MELPEIKDYTASKQAIVIRHVMYYGGRQFKEQLTWLKG